MKRIVGLILVAASLVHAQSTEIGARFGYGAAAAGESVQSGAVAGVAACFVCSGRFVPFAEYLHFQSVGTTTDIRTFDLFGGGLRIQSRGRVRPFFDAGFAYGVDRFGYRETRYHGNPGLVLAGGAAIPLGSRAYLRPEFRVYALRGHAVVTAGVEVGFGFGPSVH